jgi:hypothetical protein
MDRQLRSGANAGKAICVRDLPSEHAERRTLLSYIEGPVVGFCSCDGSAGAGTDGSSKLLTRARIDGTIVMISSDGALYCVEVLGNVIYRSISRYRCATAFR